MKKKTFCIIKIMLLIIISLTIPLSTGLISSYEHDIILWFPTDMQLASNRPDYHPKYWADAISDTNNLSHVEYSVVLGDCINGYPGHAYIPTWRECLWGWTTFYHYYDKLNCSQKNIIIGNHDIEPFLQGEYWFSYRNMSRLHTTDSCPYGNYTIKIGNILIIALNCEYQLNGGYYTHQIGWLQGIIEKNINKNIIILCHYPPYNIYNRYTQLQYIIEEESRQILDIINNNSNVVAYLHGHIHDNGGNHTKINNCVFIDCDSINKNNLSKSCYLLLKNNRKIIICRTFIHNTDSWDDEIKIELKYFFKEESKELCGLN